MPLIKDLLVGETKTNSKIELDKFHKDERIAKDELKHAERQQDLKVDINLEVATRQSSDARKRGDELEKKHHFEYETIEQTDILLMQVPNINESGYYSGIVALKSYINKYHSDISIKVIDPIIDYFYENPPDLRGKFMGDFNTFVNSGKFWIMYQHKEIYTMMDFISKYIDKAKPRFFGFSLIDGNIDASLALSKLVKERYPDIKTLLGGNGAQMLNGGLMPSNEYNIDTYHWIDYIVRGDGEQTLVDLYNCNETHEELNKINGLIWQKHKTEPDSLQTVFVSWVYNEKRDNTAMEDLPFPDYEDLKGNFYYLKSYGDSVPLVFSKGCPYRCTFCSVPTFVPDFRYRSHESVIGEIEDWVKQGKTGFFCHDSIVNGNPLWLKQLCEMIIDKGWGDGYIKWGGNFRIQMPMRDINNVRLYNKAGVEWMISGLESASKPVLRHMKKYSSIEGTHEIFRNIREVNRTSDRPIKIMLQLIIGYLNESEEDFQKTMDFVREYHDVVHEVLTCSLFLLWQPLLKQWEKEGNWIEFKNEVQWTTEFNTVEQRLDRIIRIEELFKELKLPYNVYHRGNYEDLVGK